MIAPVLICGPFIEGLAFFAFSESAFGAGNEILNLSIMGPKGGEIRLKYFPSYMECMVQKGVWFSREICHEKNHEKNYTMCIFFCRIKTLNLEDNLDFLALPAGSSKILNLFERWNCPDI